MAGEESNSEFERRVFGGEIEGYVPLHEGCSPVRVYEDGTVVNVELQTIYEIAHLKNTEIKSEYGDGDALLRPAKKVFKDIDKEVKRRPKRFWVDTPDHHHFVFSDGNGLKKAKIWAAITSESEARIVPGDPKFVPVKIGTLGNPAIAGYLYSIHDRTVDKISDQIGVSPDTIRQYLTDIAKGRRVGTIHKSFMEDREEMEVTMSFEEFMEMIGNQRSSD